MAEVPPDRESSSPKRRIDLVTKVTAKTTDKEDKDLSSTKPKNISEKSWEVNSCKSNYRVCLPRKS